MAQGLDDTLSPVLSLPPRSSLGGIDDAEDAGIVSDEKTAHGQKREGVTPLTMPASRQSSHIPVFRMPDVRRRISAIIRVEPLVPSAICLQCVMQAAAYYRAPIQSRSEPFLAHAALVLQPCVERRHASYPRDRPQLPLYQAKPRFWMILILYPRAWLASSDLDHISPLPGYFRRGLTIHRLITGWLHSPLSLGTC